MKQKLVDTLQRIICSIDLILNLLQSYLSRKNIPFKRKKGTTSGKRREIIEGHIAQ